VVREWIGPTALNQGTATLNRTLRIPVGSQIKNLGVAAFVQSPHGQVLQALSLPACS
jgi:hypothetical protein